MYKFNFKINSKAFVILGLFLFVNFFPYIVTTINISKQDFRVYEPQMYGKYVLIPEKNQKIDVEMFVPMIVYSMMPYDYEKEALKAQFVITRTYILKKMGDSNTINASDLGLQYTTYSELENKWGKKYDKRYNETMKMLVETNGEVIYYNGELVMPFYHRLSAGVTNDGGEEYIKSVTSPWDEENKGFQRILYITFDEMRDKLKDYYDGNQTNEDLKKSLNVEYEENQIYVKKITINGKEIPRDDFINLFGINTYGFSMEEFDGGYKIDARGIGDGKGLSIYGAKKMAEENKGYHEILNYYFYNVEVRK